VNATRRVEPAKENFMIFQVEPRPAFAALFCGLRLAGRPSFLLALLCAALVRPAGASTFTVGAAGCSHPDLGAALAAAASNPGFDEIRLLAGSTHQGQFLINSDALSIVGGFSTCAATSPTGSSTLRGTSSSRALFLNSFGTVSLRKLNLTGGAVTGDGGGVLFQGSGNILLIDVLVFANSATGSGGNVFVNASPGLVVTFTGTSLVSQGSAHDGGGLACAGDGRVVFRDDVLVANNQATGDGGGVHLSASCELVHSSSGPGDGIVNNSAGILGGGVYIEGGAEMNTELGGFGLAVIQGNDAAAGGGVYLSGTGTVLRAFFADIRGNSAFSSGGGIAAEDDSIAAVGRPVAGIDWCPDRVRCSLVRDNDAANGGAVWVAGSSLTVHGAHLEANSANGGAVVYLYEGAEATIHSSVVAGNDGLAPFVVGNSASLTLGNVTAVGNTAIGSNFISASSNATSVRILTSIFSQPDGTLLGGTGVGTAKQVDCVLSPTAGFLSGLPSGTLIRALYIADPRFANPATGNYQLRGNSPAIDHCDLTQWSGGSHDIDWQPRDVDNAFLDTLGTRDLGADEYRDLFSDGFESHGTQFWSVAVP
jgi:predicted outer membrane repeat protein